MAALTALGVTLVIPDFQEVSGDQGQKWADGLTVNAGRMNDRRKAKIPDDGTYITKVANPSSAGFIPMIDSAFVSRKGRDATGIAAAHTKNAASAYQKYNNGLDLAFADVDGVAAKRFVDNVNNKIGNWENAVGSKTLRFTGDKIRGRGAAATLPELLVGYQLALSWLRPADTWLAGTPYKICLAGQEGAFKAALTGMIVRTGMAIVNSNYDATTITAQNLILLATVNAFNDLTKADIFAAVVAPAVSYCVWVMNGPTLELQTQAYLT